MKKMVMGLALSLFSLSAFAGQETFVCGDASTNYAGGKLSLTLNLDGRVPVAEGGVFEIGYSLPGAGSHSFKGAVVDLFAMPFVRKATVKYQGQQFVLKIRLNEEQTTGRVEWFNDANGVNNVGSLDESLINCVRTVK